MSEGAPPSPDPAAGPLSLEATLPAEAVATLAGLATGRGAPVGLTWLDTADGALAAAGLACEQRGRGPRRLLRVLPDPGAAWRPGTPPEPLPPDAMPDEVSRDGVLPVAGFAGTATRFALPDGVQGLLLKGRLRSAAAEAPVARVRLDGPAEAVLDAIASLAGQAPLLPPRAALAEEARALALGEPLRPRRLGAPRLDPGLGVEDALVLALGHLTEVMLWHAPAAAEGTRPEGVHQMRVALRRLRSLLRAFRPACDGPSLRAFDAGLKGLAAVLGPARDWDVWLGGLGAEVAAALPEEPRIAALHDAATARRAAAYAALRPVLEGPAFRRIAWEAVALTHRRPWRAEDGAEAAGRRAEALPDFAAGLLGKRWKRLDEAGPEIGGLPDAEFHALRIEAKRMRYAGELFAPLWGRKRARRFLSRLAEVQEAFGLANDAVVARGLMGSLAAGGGADLAWAAGVAEGWALARARRARSKAAQAWSELLDAETFWNQG